MDTRERILDSAAALAQARGFNAFSYADIAEAVGIRKASIHHHFASKEDLERVLVDRYRSRFSELLREIDSANAAPSERLRAFFGLYRDTLREGKLCLCGMMASDIMSLPESLRVPLESFFDDQEVWLRRVLDEGQRHGEFRSHGASAARAKTILAGLQGGLMVARVMSDPAYFDHLVDDLVAAIT